MRTLAQITNEQLQRQEERAALERAVRELDAKLTATESEIFSNTDDRLTKLTAIALDIFSINRILRKHYPVTE